MKRAAFIGLIVLGTAFAFGLARLYTLRFENGDVYPPYSSLRADPLGARAFYESLDRLLPAERNYRPLSRLNAPRGATLFWLGENSDELEAPRYDIERLESFVAEGGRLVIAFRPVLNPPRFQSFGKPLSRAKKNLKDDDEDRESPTVNLTNRWKFSLLYQSLPRDERRMNLPASAQRIEDLPLPEALPVHTALAFGGTSNEWRVIYARTNDLATLIEKRLGRGSIVLCADAFPFSNEALLKERRADLLAWLTGPSRRAVFDEAHLGVSEDPGVATLARRYRLHGLFAALLILAALHVWKNSASLVPRRSPSTTGTAAAIAGRDSATGFINLLRRSVPRDRLLATCLEQWNADCRRTQRASPRRLAQMQAIIDEQNALAPRQRDIAATYQRFVRVLQSRPASMASRKPRSESDNPTHEH